MCPSELAAERGEPSYVWRSGQERRLQMLRAHATLENALILDAGCGNGLYADQFMRRFTPHVEAFELEIERVEEARQMVPHAVVAVAERLPYKSNLFDVVFSNEVIEHVQDDRQAMVEMVRVTKPGGRVMIFCPNRWYPVEQHGHYWRGKYHFGNTPLINYLPDVLRNRLAPHVRAYTMRGMRRLYHGLPVQAIHHGRIYGGYDNIARRSPMLGRLVRLLYALEATPLQMFGLSHFLVLQKERPS
jgi:SAM-dependent methyltransferase